MDWRIKRKEKQRNGWWATADIIIGSHPHVIQQPEIVEGKPVFFSLGNHLFDQKYPATKEGLIVDIRIRDGFLNVTEYLPHQEKFILPEIAGNKSYPFNIFL